MKKIAYLYVCMITFSAYSQNYLPILKNNTRWIEQTSAYSPPIGGASSSPLVNGIQGDTIIGSLTYKRYYSSISYPPPQIFGNFSSGILIREDSGRVYYRDVSNPGIVSDL